MAAKGNRESGLGQCLSLLETAALMLTPWLILLPARVSGQTNQAVFKDTITNPRGAIFQQARTILVSVTTPKSIVQPRTNTLTEGIKALKAGEFARAKQIFLRLAKVDPSSSNVAYLAMAESGEGHLDQAIVYFRQAIRLGDHSPSTHYNLGITYVKNHQLGPGIRELKLAMNLDPNSPLAPYALGVSLLDAGQAREAIPYLERAARESPRSPEIQANIVRAQFAAGKTAAALHSVSSAADSFADNPQLIITLADLCMRNGQARKARYLLENANELRPGDPSIKLLLAKASLIAGEPVEALAVLKNLSDKAGKPGEVMFLMGEGRALTGSLGAAASDISVALNADKRNVRYLIGSAWVDQLMGRNKEALDALRRAQELNHDTPEISYRMALSYFALGQYGQAIQKCNQVLRSTPNDDRATLLLAIINIEQGDSLRGQTLLERLVSSHPRTALFHSVLGLALFKNGNLTASQKELDQALSLDAKSVQAYIWRGEVLAKEGQRQKAIEDLETAVALQPKRAEAYSELARLYSAEGRVQKAKAALAKYKELDKNQEHFASGRFLKELVGPPQ